MENQTKQQQTWWEKNKRLLVIVGIVIIVLLIAFALAVYMFGWDWTGFTSVIGPTVHPNEQYRPAKTLWDVLQLLIVPIILAIGGFWLSQMQREGEKIAEDQRAELARAVAAQSAALQLSVLTMDLILRLDETFMQYQDVHAKLAPGGEWYKGVNGPNFPTDLVAVTGYMGLFERIWRLVEAEMIDMDTVDRLFSSRFFNIVRNTKIYEGRLVAHTSDWRGFIELGKCLKQTRQASKNRPIPSDVADKLDELISKLEPA